MYFYLNYRVSVMRGALAILIAAATIFCSNLKSSAQQPENISNSAPLVDRVEPPSWWMESRLSPIRILLHGKNLEGARISGDDFLSVSNIKISDSGTYAFFDLKIAPNAKSGVHPLRIATAGGRSETSFDVLPPLSHIAGFKGFSDDDVIYLIIPDRFSDGDPSNDDRGGSPGLYGRDNPHLYHGGDFQGIIDHLPYLKDLGVTAIWITPIYDNYNGQYPGQKSADYHGYGAVNQYGVEEHFGTLAKLRELVDQAHGLGLKVIQDQVANHVGQMHPWTTDPPTPAWLHGSPASHRDINFDIWRVMDPHAIPDEYDRTLNGWFANILPDINQDDPETANYEIENTLWWVGVAGFDGIREDTFPYVPRSFWHNWSAAISKEFPNVDAVGEVFNGDSSIVAYYQGGRKANGIDTGVKCLFDYPLYYPLHRVFVQGASFEDIANDEAHDWLFADPNDLVTFIDDHDVTRFMGEPGATISELKLALTFILTNRGIPLLYYGDEIGMQGGADPDNRRDFPGGFPGDARSAFTQEGRTPQEQDVFSFVRTLTHLRAQFAPLRRGEQKTLFLSAKQWAYARTLGEESAIVIFNNDNKPATLSIPVGTLSGFTDGATLHDRLGTTPDILIEGSRVVLTLSAQSASILTK